MKDQDCVQFLQWALPRLHMRWPGFRKVHGQVCKRLSARIRELSLPDITAYRDYLEQHPGEWQVLDSLCRINISRFYRDRGVFDFLKEEVLPELARTAMEQNEKELRCWSIGCASGEEPYTLAILWKYVVQPRYPSLALSIIATDADPVMLERGRRGCYTAGGLKELPKSWKEQSFTRTGDEYCLQSEERGMVAFFEQDIRSSEPEGMFHLILCRNAAFTYFDEGLQRELLEKIGSKLFPGGVLVLGIHESLPPGSKGFKALSEKPGVCQKYS